MGLLRSIFMFFGIGLLIAVAVAWCAALWGNVGVVATAPIRPGAVDLPPPPPLEWPGRVPPEWGAPSFIVVGYGPGIRVGVGYSQQDGTSIVETGWPVRALRATELSPNMVTDRRKVSYGGGILLERKVELKLQWKADVSRMPGAPSQGPPVLVMTTETRSSSRRLPLKPLWGGLLIDAGLFAAVLAGSVVGVNAARRWSRRRRGLCPGCGYPVGTGERCPECGLARD